MDKNTTENNNDEAPPSLNTFKTNKTPIETLNQLLNVIKNAQSFRDLALSTEINLSPKITQKENVLDNVFYLPKRERKEGFENKENIDNVVSITTLKKRKESSQQCYYLMTELDKMFNFNPNLEK